MNNVAKDFGVLATNLIIPIHNYFGDPNKIIFRSVAKFLNQQNRSFRVLKRATTRAISSFV